MTQSDSSTDDNATPQDALRVTFAHVSGPENRGVEVRKIGAESHETVSMYVDSPEAFIDSTADGSPGSQLNTYFAINRLRDGVKYRNLESLRRGGKMTSDSDVVHLVTFFIDIDPVRTSGVSATDDELNAAIVVGDQVLADLRAKGWTDPLYSGTSGNGVAIFFKIDLPNTPENVELVKQATAGISERFSTDDVEIDTTTFNPSRIAKVPGTVAHKGSHRPERPWRRARVGRVNPDAGIVTADQLAAVAGDTTTRTGQGKKSSGRKATTGSASSRGTPQQMETVRRIEAALTNHGYKFHQKQGDNAILIVVEGCLTSEAHEDGGYFSIGPSGRWSYGCQHDSCKCRGAETLSAEAAVVLGLPVPDESRDGQFPRTDLGNAERLVARYGPVIRYNNGLGWLTFDGTRFVRGEGRVIELMKETAKAILDEALDAAKDASKMADGEGKETAKTEATALLKWAFKSQNAREIANAVKLAKSDPAIYADDNAFDSNPYALNVLNGTVDLKTGSLAPHDRAALHSKIVPIGYDPAAACPGWLAYLNTIHGGDTVMIGFIQRLVGYSLTGLTTEQVFMLMWGPPGTGKSTFIEMLRRVFGGYAVNTETETFTAKTKSGRATPEIAKLQGARLVTASESEQGQRLAVARLKNLTGGDTVTASNLYEAPFDFVPVLKLWYSTNHKPRVPADESGVWDRMILLPFQVDMRNSPDRVRNMAEKLASELPGILTWAVQGAVAWNRDGLGERPERAKTAQDEYRNESDELGDFLDEKTDRKPDFKAPSGALYQAYKAWAIENGFRPLNVKRFKEKMQTHGFELKSQTKGNVWIGLQLIPVTAPTAMHGGAGRVSNPFGKPA